MINRIIGSFIALCLILPAFGQLTGLHILKKTADTCIYPVLMDEVIALP